MSKIPDSWAKFYRAQTHAQTMMNEISTWMERQPSIGPFGREFKFNPTEGRFVWRVTSIPTLPVGWALLAGDAFTNYRAALDYIAWQIVDAGTRPIHTLTDSEQAQVQFPIYISLAGFNGNLDRRLPGVDDQSRAYVEFYQPYRQRPHDPDSNPLAVLANLSRKDKHRQLQLAFAGNVEYRTILNNVENFTIDRIELPHGAGVVKLGTEMVCVYGTPVPGGEPKVNLSLQGTTQICFEDGNWVPETLGGVSSHVHAALTTFDLVL